MAHTAYDSLGNVVATWGASYPVAFGYDTAGRMTAMATTRDPALGTTNLLSLLPDGVSLTAYSLQPAPSLDVTRWLYDQATGLLTNKVYADGNGTAYAYTQAGRLSERRWSRGVTAAYGYDSFGQLASIAYSDGTPDVAYAYDRLGRMIFAVSGGSTNAFAYSGLARVAETQGMAALTRAYDQFGRPGAIGINNTCPFSDWVWYASHDFAVNYSYDGSGRLSGAAANCPLDDQWGNYAAFKMSYAFGTGSDLIVETGCEFDENFGCDVAPVSRKIAYEPLRGLVSGVTNTWDGAAVRSYAYDNDALGRRVARTDTAGQVVTANAFGYNLRSEVTNAAMGGTTYSYAYDPIGNRQWAAAGGALTEYASNPLNQYTGLQSTAYSLQPSYDADGNMTAYGPWTYTWDGENRMSSACSNGVLLVTNVYDHMSRRIRKEVSAYNASTGNFEPVTCNSFLWDGWNVVREIHSSNIPAFQCSTNYYTWGLDLSGTLQGAGGVGGLLAVTRVGPESQQPQVFYPCYDANGNVTAYLDSTGTAVGTFEYDAFGNTVAETVSGGLHLPFLFSTKYWDAETGLVMYQLRAYSPELGRWVSRDPIGEKGGVNLYVLIRNNSVNNIDQLGLNSFSDRFEPIIDNYDRLKIKLINELRNECPSEPTERVTGSGNKVCCRPSDCMSEASAIAEAYTDALREANFDRKVPAGGYWGNVLIGIYSGSFGGTYPDDLCPGLMCGGWQDLAEKTAGRVAENSKCWDFRTLYSRNGIGRFLNFDTHTWGELNSINGSVPLDPWPSGGVTY